MDFLKKAADSVTGGSKNEQTKTDASASGSASTQQKDDYGDKAFSSLASKTGYNINRDTQEKITDAGRGAFEKASGQKVPEKYSN